MEKRIATPFRTKEILNKYNIRLSKKMGQNFLIDSNIIDIIITAGNINKDDVIIEIGAGIGSLTEGILSAVETGKVIAIEKDNRLVNILNDIFNNCQKLDIISIDVLDIDWKSFFEEKGLKGKNVKIMANLPYYITTPIIMRLLESEVVFNNLVLMTQKEVADRIVADPGSKNYGALSLAVQFHACPEIIHTLTPNVFIPRPQVNSAIIRLKPYSQHPVELQDEDFFFAVIKAIFQQRRKNIKNGLTKAANINLNRELVLKSLHEIGLDHRIRGEKLSLEQIAKLSNVLYKNMRDGEKNEVY